MNGRSVGPILIPMIYAPECSISSDFFSNSNSSSDPYCPDIEMTGPRQFLEAICLSLTEIEIGIENEDVDAAAATESGYYSAVF